MFNFVNVLCYGRHASRQTKLKYITYTHYVPTCLRLLVMFQVKIWVGCRKVSSGDEETHVILTVTECIAPRSDIGTNTTFMKVNLYKQEDRIICIK